MAETASTAARADRSVSVAIWGYLRPISAYLPATGFERREEISFAIASQDPSARGE